MSSTSCWSILRAHGFTLPARLLRSDGCPFSSKNWISKQERSTIVFLSGMETPVACVWADASPQYPWGNYEHWRCGVSLFQQQKLCYLGRSNTMKETEAEGFVICSWNWLGIIPGVFREMTDTFWLPSLPILFVLLPPLSSPPASLSTPFPGAWALALFFYPFSLARALGVTIELKQSVGALRGNEYTTKIYDCSLPWFYQ